MEISRLYRFAALIFCWAGCICAFVLPYTVFSGGGVYSSLLGMLASMFMFVPAFCFAMEGWDRDREELSIVRKELSQAREE